MTNTEFIESIGAAAQAGMKSSGILASVVTAQACLESAYGTRELAVNACNLFGMKSILSGNTWASDWDGSTYSKLTKEQDTSGNEYIIPENWFNLSDEGIEDEIYDSYAMRSFMHLDFLTEQVPDATTLLHFRHLIERNLLGEKYCKFGHVFPSRKNARLLLGIAMLIFREIARKISRKIKN